MFEAIRLKLAKALLPEDKPLEAAAVNGLPPSISGSLDADTLQMIFREAEQGQMDRYLRLCAEVWGGDTSVYACVSHRKSGLLCQPWSVLPAEGSGREGALKAALLNQQLRNLSGFRNFLVHSLDACMWPLAVSRKRYKPSRTPGLLYDLAALEPVPFYRLDFRGGGGEPAGVCRLKEVDGNGQLLSGITKPLTAVEFVVHRGHMLKTFPDTYGGPLRAGLFWWFFATCDRQWWVRGLNRFGLPFLVGRVQESDKKGKAALLRAFNSMSQMIGLVVSEGTKVEALKTLDSASTDGFERFHTLCRHELSKLLTGSTLTVEAQAQGLGGGQAGVQDSRLDNITQFDGAELAETLQDQVFKPWLELNGLGCEACPTISWGATVEDAVAKMTIVKDAANSGLRLTDNGIAELNEVTGLEFERDSTAMPALGSGPVGFAAPAVPALRLVSQSRDAGDRINEAAAVALADALREGFAPVSRMLRQSGSPQELLAALEAFGADFAPAGAVRLLQESLGAHAVNGLLSKIQP